MATEDNLSLVTLGGTQSTVMGFTANRNALLGALRQVGTIGVNSRPQSPTFAATNGGLAPVGESELDGARRLSALQDAVRALGIYPGKKALVYFSGGVERVGLDHIALYRRLFDSAVQSDVSVYAIDARGLMALPPGGDASTGSSGGSGILYGTIQQSMRNAFYDSQEGLYTLASETGGSTFVNSNDLITGIRQAQEDVSSYYELGFYSATASDGKYHKLHVQLVEADKGNLNYRRGYYPIPRVNPVHTVNDTATFKSERSQAAEATKVSGAIEVEYLRVAPGWYSACLSIVWPWFNAEMSGEIDNAEGQPIAVFRRPPGLSMENVGPSTKLPGGWHCDAWLALPPGMYSLIGEARSIGKTSALEGAFSIPKSGPKGELNISSLFMEKRGGAQSLVDQLKTLDARPLNLRWAESRDGLATNADGERVFHEDQGLQLHFEVYDRGMGSGLVAQVTLLTETQIAFESSTLQPLVEESSDGVAAFEFAVPLQKVVPGHYTVQVTIVDERDRKVAFLRRGLALVE
jgi:VWFA-related protein